MPVTQASNINARIHTRKPTAIRAFMGRPSGPGTGEDGALGELSGLIGQRGAGIASRAARAGLYGTGIAF
jgi:hypothetical protein